MPKFSYVVKDQDGKAYKNVVDAPSQAAVVNKLQQQNFFIVSIKELSAAPKAKAKIGAQSSKRKFSHKKVKLHDMLTFSRQLATMLEAGVNLTRSLDVIQAQIVSQEFSRVMIKVKLDVEQGGSLSLALANHPKVFNQFWVSLIEVGEASGTIPTVLNKLAFYLEQQAEFRSSIVSGLLYPAILFFVATGAIAFFALFVGPRFESIFKSMDVDLPALTTWLLATFRFIKTHFFKLLIGIAVSAFVFWKYIHTYKGKLMWEGILFKLPTIGEVFRNIIVERFASQMAILIDAGVPILYALDISERLVDNNTCALIIGSIKDGVKGGELLVGPMQRSQFFPPMCIQLIMVGEETGELSKMLKNVSKFYQEAVRTFMARFSTIIEPFMLVFMGAVIGIIVVAMFMPMFNIAKLGGG